MEKTVPQNRGSLGGISKTPNISAGKDQKFQGIIDEQQNQQRYGKQDSNNIVDIPAYRKSPNLTAKKEAYGKYCKNFNTELVVDDANESAQKTSLYDQTTDYGTPLITKSGKFSMPPGVSQTNLMQSSLGGSSTQLQMNEPILQQQRQNSMNSPDKQNLGSSQRHRRNSNSSRGSSDHKRKSRSGAKRSYSTDPDSTERTFAYPCQAFKQFLLTVREGKIDMNDLTKSPHLLEYLQNAGSGVDSDKEAKPFQDGLRKYSNGGANNRSPPKSNQNSKANKKPVSDYSGQGSKDSRLFGVPHHSIMEAKEDEEGDNNASNAYGDKKFREPSFGKKHSSPSFNDPTSAHHKKNYSTNDQINKSPDPKRLSNAKGSDLNNNASKNSPDKKITGMGYGKAAGIGNNQGQQHDGRRDSSLTKQGRETGSGFHPLSKEEGSGQKISGKVPGSGIQQLSGGQVSGDKSHGGGQGSGIHNFGKEDGAGDKIQGRPSGVGGKGIQGNDKHQPGSGSGTTQPGVGASGQKSNGNQGGNQGQNSNQPGNNSKHNFNKGNNNPNQQTPNTQGLQKQGFKEDQQQPSSNSKQRRGRGDRSSSIEARGGSNTDDNINPSKEQRYDEKGRPINNNLSNQKSKDSQNKNDKSDPSSQQRFDEKGRPVGGNQGKQSNSKGQGNPQNSKGTRGLSISDDNNAPVQQQRFDEKGRPLCGNQGNQSTTNKGTQNNKTSSPKKTTDKIAKDQSFDDDNNYNNPKPVQNNIKPYSPKKNDKKISDPQLDDDSNNYNSNNPNAQGGKSGNKIRRKKNDRNSKGQSSSFDDPSYQYAGEEEKLSPTTEPRSISKLPKPTEKEKPPERSVKKREGRGGNDNNQMNNNVNNDSANQMEEVFLPTRGHQIAKEREFNDQTDYKLNALNNEDSQPKKFLKNKSPQKNKLFKEDGEDDIDQLLQQQYNSQQQELLKGGDQDNKNGIGGSHSNSDDNNNTQNKTQDQTGIKHNHQDDEPPKIGLVGTIQSKKTPGRQTRKVREDSKGSGDRGKGLLKDDDNDDNDSQKSFKFRDFLADSHNISQNRSRSNLSGIIGSSDGLQRDNKYGGDQQKQGTTPHGKDNIPHSKGTTPYGKGTTPHGYQGRDSRNRFSPQHQDPNYINPNDYKADNRNPYKGDESNKNGTTKNNNKNNTEQSANKKERRKRNNRSKGASDGSMDYERPVRNDYSSIEGRDSIIENDDDDNNAYVAQNKYGSQDSQPDEAYQGDKYMGSSGKKQRRGRNNRNKGQASDSQRDYDSIDYSLDNRNQPNNDRYNQRDNNQNRNNDKNYVLEDNVQGIEVHVRVISPYNQSQGKSNKADIFDRKYDTFGRNESPNNKKQDYYGRNESPSNTKKGEQSRKNNKFGQQNDDSSKNDNRAYGNQDQYNRKESPLSGKQQDYSRKNNNPGYEKVEQSRKNNEKYRNSDDSSSENQQYIQGRKESPQQRRQDDESRKNNNGLYGQQQDRSSKNDKQSYGKKDEMSRKNENRGYGDDNFNRKESPLSGKHNTKYDDSKRRSDNTKYRNQEDRSNRNDNESYGKQDNQSRKQTPSHGKQDDTNQRRNNGKYGKEEDYSRKSPLYKEDMHGEEQFRQQDDYNYGDNSTKSFGKRDSPQNKINTLYQQYKGDQSMKKKDTQKADVYSGKKANDDERKGSSPLKKIDSYQMQDNYYGRNREMSGNKYESPLTKQERQYPTRQGDPYNNNRKDQETKQQQQSKETSQKRKRRTPGDRKKNRNNSISYRTDEEYKKDEKYKSKLKEIEEQIRIQVLENPNKPIDYALLMKLQEEAARTIQMNYKKIRKFKSDKIVRHGNLVDRKVQTDPVNMFKLAGCSDMDKFKKFFFAVFYTYMMMNSIMADSFKKSK